MKIQLHELMFIQKIDDQVFIKPLCQIDCISLYNTLKLDYEYLRQWCPWIQGLENLRKAHMFIDNYISKLHENSCLRIGIFSKKGLIGCVSIFNINFETYSYELGYWISKKYINNGYTMYTCKFILNLLTTLFNLKSTLIRCHELNIPSASLASKLKGIKLYTLDKISYYKITIT